MIPLGTCYLYQIMTFRDRRHHPSSLSKCHRLPLRDVRLNDYAQQHPLVTTHSSCLSSSSLQLAFMLRPLYLNRRTWKEVFHRRITWALSYSSWKGSESSIVEWMWTLLPPSSAAP